MYTPKSFSVTDKSLLFDWVERWSFGKLATCQRGRIEINSYPFLLDREKGELLGHMGRANGQWQSLIMADDLVVCFDGPHGYVSPRWYSQPNGVPTWNFVSVQVSGKAELIKTETESVSVLERISEVNEARYGEGWTLAELDHGMLQSMLKSLVFFRIRIRAIEGKAKLSQNRSKMDRVGVVQQLAAREDTQLQDLSRLMKEILLQDQQ
ncbi:MAG: transcriptional regulator [Alcanivorax sp.]|jgi:transcriptional regulator|nr:transcriptional regulator [Pseudomonadales bacterium]TNC89497.1 MAG: transcriptional regulator [Alcanivorax sp.]HBO92202.1 transcriptional regulator [Gammaproteobacteria bacterium]HCB40466.1 transcriptional regulator [Gammaproteobacteria bacterium]|tara:strand:+ start:1956 stop:2582 length:627 start_codon:yes stop_codon:yes gene_type:complete